jgi:hypothetical protein
MTLKMKDLVIPQPLKYFVISYDLRVDNMNTTVDDRMVQETLAALLVYNKCPEIRCYVETTVHFKSTKAFEYWFEIIKEYFGKYATFVLDEIALNEKKELIHKVHYNAHYRSTYTSILEKNYENLVEKTRGYTPEELSAVLVAFTLAD